MAAPRAAAASRRQGRRSRRRPACRQLRAGSAGGRGRRWCGVGASSGAMRETSASASPISSPPSSAAAPAGLHGWRSTPPPLTGVPRPRRRPVQGPDDLVGDVHARAGEDHFLQDQVVLLGSKICLMTRLARSTTPASSSFLRWLRSSWNSRRLRCRSRSCSTSSRWRRCARLRTASARPCRACRPPPSGAGPDRRGRARGGRTRLPAWPGRPWRARPRAARARC
jgi:hypothetical protein